MNFSENGVGTTTYHMEKNTELLSHVFVKISSERTKDKCEKQTIKLFKGSKE